MLVWDETNFVTCLETHPEVGEDGASHRFATVDGDLTLESGMLSRAFRM